MERVNVFQFDLGDTYGVGRFRHGEGALGARLGAERIGAALYEPGHGEWIWPFHYHYGEEEWLYVVSGHPVLCDGEGERELVPGDLVAFPAGPAGVHAVAGPGRFVIFSRVDGALRASAFPDSDKISSPEGIFPRGSAVHYWEGEAPEAVEPVESKRPPLGTRQPVLNALSVELEHDDDDPPGFECRYRRVGPLLGASMLGATVYEFDPGQGTAPYHWEADREEWALVLAGTPVLRTPEGRFGLAVGDLVCFPAGPSGAHRFLGAGSGPARVLILSTLGETNVAVYPDSGKVGVYGPGEVDWLFRIGDAVDYWDGEGAETHKAPGDA